MQKIIINTDGGSRGNPGPAAIGIVIRDENGNVIKKYGERIGERTNNEAEYEAVIFALKKAKRLFGGEQVQKMHVEMRLDSELVTKQLSNKYKIEEEKLIPLFVKAHNLILDFGKVIFTYIPREKNQEADMLVNETLDGVKQDSLL